MARRACAHLAREPCGHGGLRSRGAVRTTPTGLAARVFPPEHPSASSVQSESRCGL